MSFAVLLLLGGYVLVYTAWHGQSIVDLALGREGSQNIPKGNSSSQGTAGAASAPAETNTTSAAAGTAPFDGAHVAKWIVPILQYARAHGWHGGISDKTYGGYRGPGMQAKAAIGASIAAAPGQSMHEQTKYPGGAVDVTDPGALDAVINSARSPYRGKLIWAGAKDSVHFSHPHGGRW